MDTRRKNNALLFLKNEKVKNTISNLLPVIGFVFIIVFFGIMTKGVSLSPFNIKILINQAIVVAIIATTATFIFSMGAFDISIGAVTCFAAVVGAIAANATKSPIVMFAMCMVSAIALSLMNGFCIAFLKLPSFIVTLATMNIISAAVTLVIGTTDLITLEMDVDYLDQIYIKIIVLIVVMLLSVILFDFTKLGKSNKIIGGNQTVASLSGISITKNILATFLVSGIGIGLGAFLLLVRTGSVSSQTASSMGFDIIMAMVLGGMPISGGAKSKITAALIGAFTITALNNGLVIMGASVGALQAIRGVIFLIIITLMLLNQREKLLPR
ncbi:inner-membrane translocator [Caldicellulosiruptor hydrothermalis 108]|uniref:Inner-membrane translocator n=1 Tax=Caldicellulosiruptor hydrothermalis (strain DSM 18901 / VKM B-2411 / 108) TaxID=632292 RepID=E4Q8S2_CALH1|nr:ABC transporter permease [Caldicellulosiruptor hydrothermalis]ADQ08046.1 inner-membrane translocator [Caldicellulosiruptor hydrothermalis 108]